VKAARPLALFVAVAVSLAASVPACGGGVSLGVTDGLLGDDAGDASLDAPAPPPETDAAVDAADAAGDPCEGKTFPACPYRCAVADGDPCSDPGTRCLPPTGTSVVCTCGGGATWSCGPMEAPFPGCATTCTPDTSDPCYGEVFPSCPRECAAFPEEGACTDGDMCRLAGSKIGDECACAGGSWSCAPHPPLGMGCNLVCQ
jgi:hypothetical protein